MLRLQVIDDKNGNPASPGQCIIRNLTLIIWPLEFVIALINPEKRLGDKLAGTRLMFMSDNNATKLNPVPTLIAVMTSSIVFLVIAFACCFLVGKLSNVQAFREKSYNGALSRQANQICADSMSIYLTPDIRVYDQMYGTSNGHYGYVSAVFELKEDYISDKRDINMISNKLHALLSRTLPKQHYEGKIKYIYRFNALGTSY